MLQMDDGLGALCYFAFTLETRNATQLQDVSILGRDLMLLVSEAILLTNLRHRQESIFVVERVGL